jgi:C_GCAxxG_C_C family probable redox protein
VAQGRADRAAELHAKGANCAQSVACAFAESLGVDEQTMMRAATGFGGGMGRLASTCGAVTGAFMALGLAHGMRTPGEAEAKERTYADVREFAKRFAAKNGNLACRDLLGVDIGTPEGLARAREEKLVATRCPGFILDAVAILEEMLKG